MGPRFVLHPLIESSELDGNRDKRLIGNTDEYEHETNSVPVVRPQLFSMFLFERRRVPPVTKHDAQIDRSS
jgi:hypothetical protein